MVLSTVATMCARHVRPRVPSFAFGFSGLVREHRLVGRSLQRIMLDAPGTNGHDTEYRTQVVAIPSVDEFLCVPLSLP